MKKFRVWAKLGAKCFFVLLPLWLVWGYIWAFPLKYVEGELPHDTSLKKFVNVQSKKKYDIIILGDSSANAAYVPEYMSERTINLALGGMTPVEMYYILCDYLRNHPVPKVCYITFIDLRFHAHLDLYKRTFYNHNLSWKYDLEILQKARLYNEKSVLTSTIHTVYKDWLAYRMRFPHKYMPAVFNAGFNSREQMNMNAVNLARIHRGKYIAPGVKETAQYHIYNNYSTFKPTPYLDFYFRKILEKCKEQKIQVRFVQVNYSPNKQVPSTFDTSISTYFKTLKNEFENVHFLGRMDIFKMCDFWDQNHLNIHGALKFTKAIKSLYPEDFADAANDPVSRNTIDGMTDYLQMENYPGEILRRLEDTDFSAVIIRWPGKGGHDEDVLAAVDECYPAMREQANPLIEKNGTKAAIFFVNGLAKNSQVENNDNEFSFSDGRIQQPLRVRIENDATATVHLPWKADSLKIEPKLAMDMTVVILNHYDNKVVAVKHFAFSHGSYQLIPNK